MTRALDPQSPPPVSTGPIRHEWAELAERTGASPFVHPGWVEAWTATHAARLDLIAVRREGRLVAVLPMVGTRRGPATPTDWHTPLFEAIALDDEALVELAEILVERGSRRVRLGFMDEQGRTHRVLGEALEQAGYRLRVRPALRSPYITLSGDWDQLLATWPAKRRADLRRRRRRLEELGTVTFDVHDGGDRLPALLDEGFAVEASGWKGAQGTAIVAEGTEELYRRAAECAAAAGSLRLAFLRLDDEAIAFDYCFETGGVHYLVKTGFRPEYAAYAPGKLLRAFMIERSFAEGLRAYDFVGDDDPWKREWTDSVRTTVTVDAYTGGVLGRLAEAGDLAGRAAGRLRRRLRRLR